MPVPVKASSICAQCLRTLPQISQLVGSRNSFPSRVSATQCAPSMSATARRLTSSVCSIVTWYGKKTTLPVALPLPRSEDRRTSGYGHHTLTFQVRFLFILFLVRRSNFLVLPFFTCSLGLCAVPYTAYSCILKSLPFQLPS